MSLSVICTNILYFNIFIIPTLYIIIIFLVYFWLPYVTNILISKISTITLFYIFGGYWYPSTHPPKIKLSSCLVDLGFTSSPSIFLPIIILVMFLYFFECMCQWVPGHSHTTLFCSLGLFILGFITYYSFVPVLSVADILQPFLVLFRARNFGWILLALCCFVWLCQKQI